MERGNTNTNLTLSIADMITNEDCQIFVSGNGVTGWEIQDVVKKVLKNSNDTLCIGKKAKQVTV